MGSSSLIRYSKAYNAQVGLVYVNVDICLEVFLPFPGQCSGRGTICRRTQSQADPGGPRRSGKGSRCRTPPSNPRLGHDAVGARIWKKQNSG